MFLLYLSLRNLLRHKRRTLLTVFVMAVSLFIYLTIYSLILGLEKTSYLNIIQLETGHLQIMAIEYQTQKEQLPLENLIPFQGDLLQELKGIPGSYTPRLKAMASLITKDYEVPVMVIGIDREREKEVFRIWDYLSTGTLIKEKNQVVMGESLAYFLDLEVGDYLTLLLRTREGTFNTIEGTIGGLLHTPHPLINDGIVFLPLGDLMAALNVDGVSEIVIHLLKEEELETIVEDLRERLEERGLSPYSFLDTAHLITGMVQAGRIENVLIISLLLMIASIGIMNTVILSALERMEEIGMMKALGLKEGEIILLFMLEALNMGILGGVLGCLLGLGGVIFLNGFGLDLAWFGGGETAFGLPVLGRFYGAYSPSSFLFMFLFCPLISLLASYFPARWAAKKDPIKAIYHK